MFFPEYQYEQTIIITLVGDERLKTTETGLKAPGWLVLFKDSASVLDGVLEENEARKLINLQTIKTVTSHLVPAE